MNQDAERRFFLEMVGRLGYAKPRHMQMAARAQERAILNKMVAEGILMESFEKIGNDGLPNALGKGKRTIWIATEKGKPLAEKAYSKTIADRKSAERGKYAAAI